MSSFEVEGTKVGRVNTAPFFSITRLTKKENKQKQTQSDNLEILCQKMNHAQKEQRETWPLPLDFEEGLLSFEVEGTRVG